MSRKLLLEDAHGQREFLLVGTLTVGRDPRCEISANDPLLSRQHAEFVETASGVLVRDLHSQNGIRVNDVTVKEAALRTGDIVQIARMRLRFLEEASTQPGVAAGGGVGASTEEDDKTRVLKSPRAGGGFAAPPSAAESVVSPAAPRSGADANSAAPRAQTPPPPIPASDASASASESASSGGSAPVEPAGLLRHGAGRTGHAGESAGAASVSGLGATLEDAPVAASAPSAAAAPGAAPASRSAGAPPIEDDGDRTRVVAVPPGSLRSKRPTGPAGQAGPLGQPGQPGPSGAAAPSSASPSEAGQAGATVGVQAAARSATPALSSAQTAHASPATASAAPSSTSSAASARSSGAGSASAHSAAATARGSTSAPSAAAPSLAVPSTAGAADEAAPVKATVRAPRGTWAGRVLLRVLMLGLVCSLASAIPLMIWHQQQVRAVAHSRATTLSNWFAAEAAIALERGQDAGPAVDALSAEAGIVAARVLSPEGHVIAPAARAAEVIAVFPGVGAAPADVLRQQSGWNGDLLEVVQPIATSRGPRTALAWITLNPTTEFGGSSLVIVAPAVVAAIFLAWIVAMLITRPTLRALGQLNEDIELALSGRLDGVTDPLGAKPVKELTDTISYLAARLRTSGLDVGLERGRRGPFMVGGNTAQQPALGGAATPAAAAASGSAANIASAPSSPPAHAAAQPASRNAPGGAAGGGAGSTAAAAGRAVSQGVSAAHASAESMLSGVLIVDTAFRVTQADPTCAALLGTRADALVGRHLLDAITDRLVVDAVLGCLSALPASGERDASATDASGRPIAVKVGRTAKDQPVTVTLRALEARDA